MHWKIIEFPKLSIYNLVDKFIMKKHFLQHRFIYLSTQETTHNIVLFMMYIVHTIWWMSSLYVVYGNKYILTSIKISKHTHYCW
jgi:hypothetical protein